MDALAARRVLCHGPRGAGRSWWLDRAANAAAAEGFRVARAAGSPTRQDLALGGLATLLAPFTDQLAALGADGERLRLALAGAGGADPADVKLATLHALTALADIQPLWIGVDDIDLLDSSSRAVLDAVMERCIADPIVLCATATQEAAFAADQAVRLEPLPEATLVSLLVGRGLAAVAAERCAAAAGGNPGVAVAMADALSEAQRAGQEPVADLPRVGGHVALDLQGRMRALGEPCCRALVVAAAVADGALGAVDGALTQLGEPGLVALEPAEEAGMVELVGTRVVFPDAFTRHAAYHLLAPASRRAAHRALAAQFSEPHQATARVWHLVGAAAGPSDMVAEALELVAGDALRRGATATATRTYERAVEFAATADVRERALAAAIGAALEDADVHHAEQLAHSTVARTAPLQAAVAEVRELLTGRTDGTGPRALVWQAAASGEYRAVLGAVGEVPRHPLDAVPAAVALRHAGRTREARDLLASVDVRRAAHGTFIACWWNVAAADLEVLAGREPDAATLDVPSSMPDWLRVQAAAVAARAQLMAATDGGLADSGAVAIWADLGHGTLAAVRTVVRAAVLAGDAAGLDAAVALAEQHRLPVEAGEARLWQVALRRAAGEAVPADATALALATLHRCGVRGWDRRAAAVGAPVGGSAVKVADPALDALSPSERRVAEAVAEGMTNREAAAALFLSVKTVDFHLQQIYRKLGLRSRTELAVRMTGAGPRVGNHPGAGRGDSR